jgi:hypothetical protein
MNSVPLLRTTRKAERGTIRFPDDWALGAAPFALLFCASVLGAQTQSGSPAAPSLQLPTPGSLQLPTPGSAQFPALPSAQLPAPPSAQLPAPPSAQLPAPLTASQVLDAWVGNVESELVPAAIALAGDKFDFAPVKGEFHGVRTFGGQIKHVAASNYQIGAKILGEKPPHGEHGEAAPEWVRSKPEMVEYLKGSFAYLHRAMPSIGDDALTEPIPGAGGTWQRTRLGLAVDAVAHSYDHYGQMVEYLRMNGVVPPASR